MFAAFFVSCLMNATGEQNCSVAHTEMADYSKSLTECTQMAAMLQESALQAALIADIHLVISRKESGCAAPAEAEQRAVDEFNKLHAQGVVVELFEF